MKCLQEDRVLFCSTWEVVPCPSGWYLLCTHPIMGVTNWPNSVGYKRRRAGRGAGGAGGEVERGMVKGCSKSAGIRTLENSKI